MATPTASDVAPDEPGNRGSGDGGAAPTIEGSGERGPSRSRSIVEWIVVFAGAALVAIVIKTFVAQAFFIPSESMVPTLEVGDRVLVNKLSYHLHPVNRGDVVVFERPEGESEEIKDLIKRVIALPGETLVIQDSQGNACSMGSATATDCSIYINGTRLDEPYLVPGTPIVSGPGTASYPHRCTPQDPCVIPPNSVWVMGDNRGNSKDSRWFGPIAEDKIVGRAFVTVWPFSRFGGL